MCSQEVAEVVSTLFHSNLELDLAQHFTIPTTVCVLSHFSCDRLFTTPWTVAHQAPRSVGFSRQEYWSGLPYPSPGDLHHPGIGPRALTFPAVAGFTTSAITKSSLPSIRWKGRLCWEFTGRHGGFQQKFLAARALLP